MTNEINMSLADKLKKLRKDFCMTQDEVAELLDMSRTSFSKYENGAANPPLRVLRKLAAIYNVPIDFLIQDEQNMLILNSNPDIADESLMYFSQLSAEERNLILRLRLMTKEDKDNLLKPLTPDD
ncbi:MAG: helix-turn-helix transcriptional regulator [Acutalibacteraceae bacterium]|nr:helix-turn-helix transcriptional regulator [Acutalibacteraceae bacterium]